MRVSFISTMTAAPWGGSEELWSQSASRLLKAGCQVAASVAYWPQLSPRVAALKDAGISLTVRNRRCRTVPRRLWSRFERGVLGRKNEIYEWLDQIKPDLTVVSQGGNADGLEALSTCRERGAPYAVIVQSNTESWWPKDDDSAEMARVFRSARKVFCVSRRNLELLIRQTGESLPNAEVVWNPWNVPRDNPPEWPAENSHWKLACVARLEPAFKGQDLLFEVLSQQNWRERNIKLNLYGSGGCETGLKKLVNLLNLANVQFHGHVADVCQIWRENHLLVLPSRVEGLPLALVEAMWCGRPALVTDVGGSAELCVDEQTGFVAPAATVGHIGQALERGWNCRQEWKRMGAAARARANQLIPKDPVADFCGRLEGCVGGCSDVRLNSGLI